jgi:hypothetical protein
MFSIDEISRSDDNTAIRQRRVNDLGFSGGLVANPSACFHLMKSCDRMIALQYVNAELLV